MLDELFLAGWIDWLLSEDEEEQQQAECGQYPAAERTEKESQPE